MQLIRHSPVTVVYSYHNISHQAPLGFKAYGTVYLTQEIVQTWTHIWYRIDTAQLCDPALLLERLTKLQSYQIPVVTT